MMKKKSPSRRQFQNIRPVPTNCPFCKGAVEPDYKNYEELLRYISEREKILGKARSGLCAKHQRRLTIAIKRARQLGLIHAILPTQS